jgi:hypothetical protein
VDTKIPAQTSASRLGRAGACSPWVSQPGRITRARDMAITEGRRTTPCERTAPRACATCGSEWGVLTADSHVHSEWSWDTGGPDSDARGTMVDTCERAVRIGLPALFFTEHLDLDDTWRAGAEEFPASNRRYITKDGYWVPPPLDVDGYFDAIERCRRRFPKLTILTGVEFGQPHLFEARARSLVDLDRFDRINGSLHTRCPSGRIVPSRSRSTDPGRPARWSGPTWLRSPPWCADQTRSRSSPISITRSERGPRRKRAPSTLDRSKKAFGRR